MDLHLPNRGGAHFWLGERKFNVCLDIEEVLARGRQFDSCAISVTTAGGVVSDHQ